MKIKTQFTILILVVIFIPLVAVVTVPVYHYICSPERYLLKGYKEVRNLDIIDLTENSWNTIEKMISHVPPNVEILVYYDSTVILSNFPEFKNGTKCHPADIFDLIQSTSYKYDYQVQDPYMGKSYNRGNSINDYFLVISRSPVYNANHKKFPSFVLPAFLGIVIFEFIAVILIFQISRNVSKSIISIEEKTHKIADGELDTQVEELGRQKNPNEITSLLLSLDKMRISLKDDQERRTKFIMGISHDLRTPVALIKGYTEAITDGVVTDMDSIKKSLGIIHTKADQLENMINDLINYVKLSSSEWKRDLVKSKIKPFLENFASSIENTGEFYKRTIVTNIQINDDVEIAYDEKLCQHVLENIYSNAIRYSQEGGTVSFSAVQDDDFIKVSISDTGQGISEKDIEHIFDLFYRGTNSRREAGFGIGLSFVKTIVDTMGWKISVSSKEDKGTSFVITIPYDKKGT